MVNNSVIIINGSIVELWSWGRVFRGQLRRTASAALELREKCRAEKLSLITTLSATCCMIISIIVNPLSTIDHLQHTTKIQWQPPKTLYHLIDSVPSPSSPSSVTLPCASSILSPKLPVLLLLVNSSSSQNPLHLSPRLRILHQQAL